MDSRRVLHICTRTCYGVLVIDSAGRRYITFAWRMGSDMGPGQVVTTARRAVIQHRGDSTATPASAY